jgi:hypothetical protein
MYSARVLFLVLAMVVGVATGQIPTARQDVLEAKRARPTDPWPRGQGHVVLAIPGSLEVGKAYHEPGGSFSPEFGSFGVSLWITDSRGAIVQTSDSIPLPQIHQRFVWRDDAVVPSIRTETSEYVTDWSIGSGGESSQLLLNPKLASDHKLMLVIRSAGPAGAAIESLRWTGTDLLVNGRYKLQISPAPASIYVGPEGPSGWVTAMAASSSECSEQHGWCYARLELPRDHDSLLRIVDTFPPRSPRLAASGSRATLLMDLPDQRFADSVNAQVAHLMMGLVGNQTRPGDPNQYPLAWLRDGSYQVVALARAGQLDTASELARYLAEKDFFGGFGAEGDNPGLALWAMGEVASLSRVSTYDRYLWPHVYRKAQFILGMMTTREPIQRIFAGPLVPEHRAEPDVYTLALPAKDGLVQGSMDLHYPALNATAVSYNGLLSAAEIADRLKHGDDASRWRAAAAQLKDAWNAAFKPADDDADSFIAGIWPTWIAADHGKFRKGLDKLPDNDWDATQKRFRENPEWTYFDFSFAHQFLFLEQSRRTWDMLEWFWNHQPSPGLYSWWEGSGEENNSHEWEYVRGWVAPSHVTPHYWAAAQCLLLQIDMLAYVDRSSSQPAIVIGGGVPASWTAQPMHVHGLLTKLGRVDWDWDGNAMVVSFQGRRLPIRLGPAFPGGARVSVASLAAP